MRATDFITEAPLPDDWDKQIYQKSTPFKVRLAYAKERAAKLGHGSSRVAFDIEYQGRPTVLKIAKNKKGIAQNQAEATLLSDGYIHSQGKVIPIIDYDTEGYTWLHCELAQQVNEPTIMTHFHLAELSLSKLVSLEGKYASNPMWRNHAMKVWDRFVSVLDESQIELIEDWVSFFHVLRVDFGVDLADFMTPDNWGIYQGHPVIIDVGYTEHVRNSHYR